MKLEELKTYRDDILAIAITRWHTKYLLNRFFSVKRSHYLKFLKLSTISFQYLIAINLVILFVITLLIMVEA